jgi:A/G-specific adenine glycosylase
MLQQTVVATVIPYYHRFLRLFPSVGDLARADEAEVLHAWSGLGYYSRARSLKRAAQMVVDEFGGSLPDTEADLLRLPGVGPYTAAAVAAIGFEKVAFALDGNAIRVMARVVDHHGFVDDETTKTDLRALGLSLVPKGRPGDFAQAVMELGARVCVPRNPKCSECPVLSFCKGYVKNTVAELPRRKPKRAKKPVNLLCLAVLRGDQLLLHKQPSPGLLGGTWTLPSREMFLHEDVQVGVAALAKTLGISPKRNTVAVTRVHHVFTHLDVWATVVTVHVAKVAKQTVTADLSAQIWLPCDEASTLPLASFTKKLLACVRTSEKV